MALDFLKHGRIHHSSLEKDYIKHMNRKHDLDIVTTEFFVGKLQCNLRVYINLRGQENAMAKFLYTAVSGQSLDACINMGSRYSKEAVDIAEMIADEYLSIFHYKREELPKIAIYIYDFSETVIEYAYGNSALKLKNIISKKYRIDPDEIFVFYEPAVTILFDDEKHYHHVLERKDEIIRDCYLIVKKYDKFGGVQLENMAVNLYLKSKLDKEKLNNYLMKR